MATSNLNQQASQTAAQEEFNNLVSKASASEKENQHPADNDDYQHDKNNSDIDEDDEYLSKILDETMRMPAFDRMPGSGSGALRLPHRDFDNGRTTGVKGVIADARSYEEARRNGSHRRNTSRQSTSMADKRSSTISFLKDDGEDSEEEDEEFIERWRHQRRMELEKEGNDIRNRRTSPSVRRYGRFDEVDALGYLDAIEKVTRETVVVVFVYDPEVSLLPFSSSAMCLQYPVPSITSHLRRSRAISLQKPINPLRPHPLRRDRVRQRRCPSHLGLQEPRRSLCKLDIYYRSDTRGYTIRHQSSGRCP
jgi:hypothetical protein